MRVWQLVDGDHSWYVGTKAEARSDWSIISDNEFAYVKEIELADLPQKQLLVACLNGASYAEKVTIVEGFGSDGTSPLSRETQPKKVGKSRRYIRSSTPPSRPKSVS